LASCNDFKTYPRISKLYPEFFSQSNKLHLNGKIRRIYKINLLWVRTFFIHILRAKYTLVIYIEISELKITSTNQNLNPNNQINFFNIRSIVKNKGHAQKNDLSSVSYTIKQQIYIIAAL